MKKHLLIASLALLNVLFGTACVVNHEHPATPTRTTTTTETHAVSAY